MCVSVFVKNNPKIGEICHNLPPHDFTVFANAAGEYYLTDVPERARARAFTEMVSSDERPSTATLAAVQAALPEGGRLLDYFTTGVLEQDIPLLRQVAATTC